MFLGVVHASMDYYYYYYHQLVTVYWSSIRLFNLCLWIEKIYKFKIFIIEVLAVNVFFQKQKHEIPVSAIPCLSYRRALEHENEKAESDVSTEIPNARIETVTENMASQNLKPEHLKEYCERLFQFKAIKVSAF